MRSANKVLEAAKPGEKDKLKRRGRAPMSVILRDVPPGYHWGWFSREEPRMHLQTVDKKQRSLYKIWLEEQGRRAFEPDGPIPAKILKRVTAEVQKLRRHIEARWACFMIDNDWIKLHVSLPDVAITAYPNTPHKFTRKVNLQEWFSAEAYARIRREDVFLNSEMGALAVFKDVPEDRRHDFDLTRILWHG